MKILLLTYVCTYFFETWCLLLNMIKYPLNNGLKNRKKVPNYNLAKFEFFLEKYWFYLSFLKTRTNFLLDFFLIFSSTVSFYKARLGIFEPIKNLYVYVIKMIWIGSTYYILHVPSPKIICFMAYKQIKLYI